MAQVLHDQESLLDFDARVTELAAPRDVKIDGATGATDVHFFQTYLLGKALETQSTHHKFTCIYIYVHICIQINMYII